MHGTAAVHGTAALDQSVTVPAAAEILGVSERWARQLVADGQLPSFKIAGKRKVLRSDLDAYVDQLRAQNAPTPTPPDDRPPAGPESPRPPAGPKGGK